MTRRDIAAALDRDVGSLSRQPRSWPRCRLADVALPVREIYCNIPCCLLGAAMNRTKVTASAIAPVTEPELTAEEAARLLGDSRTYMEKVFQSDTLSKTSASQAEVRVPHRSVLEWWQAERASSHSPARTGRAPGRSA